MNKYINPIFQFVFLNGPVVEFLPSVSEVQLLGSNPLKLFFFFYISKTIMLISGCILSITTFPIIVCDILTTQIICKNNVSATLRVARIQNDRSTENSTRV